MNNPTPHDATSGTLPIGGDPPFLATIPAPDPPSPLAVPCPLVGERYRLDARIAEGGMGEIWRAYDRVLDRTVAIKRIKAELLSQAGFLGRFDREARITGRLQHPGIPAVYDLGTLADGNPFLAMKLIEGRTFAALLAERSDPAADLPRCLQVFEQLCHTLAYAHGQGMIHRDLKPANVMVGAFGEVQVMDWGLAKVLASGGRQPPDSDGQQQNQGADAPRSPGHGATQIGTVLGTSAYMPPEQARGQRDRMDARADVFALGAILCEILTGLPPYTGLDTLLAAWDGDLGPAQRRLDACAADPELVALARRCLAPEREDRPANADAVAQAVAAYRAGVAERLRRAEQDRAVTETRIAEGHKRVLVQRLLTGAGVLILALVVVGWWWYDRQRTEARLAIAAGLEAGEEAVREQRLDAAEAALAEAGRRLGNAGPADLRHRYAALDRDLRLSRRLDRAFAARWTLAEGKFQLRVASTAYRDAFAEYDLPVESMPTDALVEALSAARIKDRLIAGLEDWMTLTTDQKELDALALALNVLDDDDDRRQARRAVASQDRATLRDLAKKANSDTLSARLALLLAEQEAVPMEHRLRLLRAARDRHPDDVALAFQLGNLRAAPVKADDALVLAEAEGAFRAILARQPDNPAGWNNLSVVLRERKDLAGALNACQRAIALDPDDAVAYSNRGLILHDLGQLDGALASCQAALARNARYAPGHCNLSLVLHARGDLDAALRACDRSIELNPNLAMAHSNRCVLLREKKDPAAVAAARRAIEINPDLVTAHMNLGGALLDQGNVDGGLAAFRKAIELNPDLAMAHNNLAFALAFQGEVEAALVACRKAITLDPNLALAHRTLGLLLVHRREFAEAVAAYRKAIALKPAWADPHFNLGEALLLQGRFAEAVAPLERADELGRKTPGWNFPAAKRLGEAKRWPDLEARLPRVLQGAEPLTAPGEWAEYAGQSLLTRKRYADAARLFRRCFEREPALLENLADFYRYNAACAAVLAASGEGEQPPAEAERPALRRQALAWLQSDLAARKKADNLGLADWPHDPDLASVRDPEALAKLPDRAAWGQLWDDVRTTLSGGR